MFMNCLLKATVAGLVASLMITAVTPPAWAAKTEMEMHEYCRLVADASKNIMEMRQDDFPRPLVEEAYLGSPITEEMVREAYRSPLRWTPKVRQKEIGDFVQAWVERCYRGQLPTD